MFEFTSKCKLGVRVLDEQHKELFRLANVLLDMVESDQLDMMEVLLMSFIEYTSYHFVTEESLYSKMNVIGLEEHKRIHQDILKKLNNYHKLAMSQPLSIELIKEICDFITEWVNQHTLNEDFKMLNLK